MTDIAQLFADIAHAKQVAETSTAHLQDGGACNLDSTFYPLAKGERSAPIVLAFARNGVHSFPLRWAGMRGVLATPPGSGCADRRYQSNECFLKTLQMLDWPVIGYYQLD